MRNLLDITDFSVEELDELIHSALDIIDNPGKYSEICKGRILASLFFEPSTRTRLSFESAMHYLGGSVISVPDASTSSATKGESVADTARMISGYADIIAMRHPKEGAAYVLAQNSSIPVVNAGDGGHCHPTQTLADLLTIYREIGRFDNLTIGLCGDLLYGRTVHSLINAMIRYKNVKFILISPEELKLPDYMKEVLEQAGAIYKETSNLEEEIPGLDVLYMTRIQRERFTDPSQYERLKDSYCLTIDKLKNAKSSMRVLHPLPRVNEISVKVDKDPRAAYFRQAKNGRFMRMALIIKLLFNSDNYVEKEKSDDIIVAKTKCNNPKCISQCEQELEYKFINGKCLYCESKA